MPFDEGMGLFVLRKRSPKMLAKPKKQLKHNWSSAGILQVLRLWEEKR